MNQLKYILALSAILLPCVSAQAFFGELKGVVNDVDKHLEKLGINSKTNQTNGNPLITNDLNAQPSDGGVLGEKLAENTQEDQGVWYQSETDSLWDRCWLGQTWSEATQECKGKPLKLTWYDAQDYIDKFINTTGRAGYNDWRLPTAYELSLRRTCIMIMPFGEKKDFGWLEESNGSVLTKDGRKSIMQVVTKSIPDNNGGFVDVPARCARGYAQHPDFDFWALNQTKGGVWYLAGTNYQARSMLQTESADAKFYAWVVRSDKKPVLSAEQGNKLLTDDERLKDQFFKQMDRNPTQKTVLK